MKYFASTNHPPGVLLQASTHDRRYGTPLIVFAACLLVFATAISRSFYDGRLASPMTHDDVNYFAEAIQSLTLLRTKGLFALFGDFVHGSLHAPLATYQAMFAYLIFGIKDWAPYASNLVLVLIFLGFAAHLLRNSPTIVVAAAMVSLVALPISSNAITEFAPEIKLSLFIAIGVVLMVKLPVIDASLRPRFLAGLCFGIGSLAHPSAFPFALIAVLAIVSLAISRDIIWRRNYGQLRLAVANSLLSILFSVWLPALYLVPRYHEYSTYFYDALFNPAEFYWYDSMSVPQHVGFYLFGDGGRFMFGHKFLAYAGIISFGLAAAWWHKDRQLLARQAELMAVAFLFWLLPTLSLTKNYLFGSALGFLIGLMTIIAFGSIYNAIRGTVGAIVVVALSLQLLVFYKPSHLVAPNTAETSLERGSAFGAIDRFEAVLLGNATDPLHTQVYMTNIGAYAPNILQYYFLKADPTLDWRFYSEWKDSNPHHHMAFIHSSRQDFVIAGQGGNGLTYSPFALPAEDPVFEAMWRDPDYIAVDRFDGLSGREIALFARRGNFAGWRPISGLIGGTKQPDDPRDIPKGLAHLQTFASRAVQADLEIEWVGTIAAQDLTVFVNDQQLAKSFATENKPSSLKTEISLSPGTNDIVLQSEGPLKLQRFLVIPQIVPERPAQGIVIASATYGGNCGAPVGNATGDLVLSCAAKSQCEYSVDVRQLGDPANGCAKNFAVSYFCPSETTKRHEELAGEAGLGKIVNLRCAPASSGPLSTETRPPRDLN